jgi:fatty-acyl-CoA synthase
VSTSNPKSRGGLSYASGTALSDEHGIGALTLGGYLQEVMTCFGSAEAAVIYLDGAAQRWSYTDLWQNASAVACSLIARGVGMGTRVGLLMTNRLEFLSCFFGVALAGGVATPISTFFTATELDEVLRLSACSMLLLEKNVLKKEFAFVLADLEPQIGTSEPGKFASIRYPYLRHLAFVDSDTESGVIEGWRGFLASGQEVNPSLVEARAKAIEPSDPGILIFSSGSTGKAKGILSAHQAVCLQLWRWKYWYAIDEPPRTWSANGFFFSGNFAMALGGTFSSGGALILQRVFNAETALTLMEAEAATMLLAWPHQWPQFEAAPNYMTTDLSALRYVDADCPLARHPTVTGVWREPKEAYGCTETFTLISVFPSGTAIEIAGKSHGQPTPGSTVKIVDPLTGETLPLGERGEIAVKGPTLMLGYLDVPLDETLDDEGFFRTNDGGHLDANGRLFWEGRLNDIIKTGGANVSPLEIDEVIRAYPGVKISQTVGVSDTLLGELVVTCIVPHAGLTLTMEGVRDFARQKLASYKVPRQVLFFREEDLNTTGSAKIKTAELRHKAAERLAAGRA